MGAEQRQQLGIGGRAADAVQFGIALRQVFQPEMIVEMQVEQGAVHVEQNGIDVGPGQLMHGKVRKQTESEYPARIFRGERGMIPVRIKERVMREKPQVLAREIVASSRLFRVEELQLRFANGVERTYERLVSKGSGYGAVMVVAMLDAEHAVLVEEYCAGTDGYQLSLAKGLIEPGEDVLVAANRELKEEAGFGATPGADRRAEPVTRLHEPEDPGGAGP